MHVFLTTLHQTVVTHAHTHTQIYTHTYMYTHTHTHPHTHGHTQTHTHVHTHTHPHTHTRTHTHTHAHTLMHTHTRTHTHSPLSHPEAMTSQPTEFVEEEEDGENTVVSERVQVSNYHNMLHVRIIRPSPSLMKSYVGGYLYVSSIRSPLIHVSSMRDKSITKN